MTAALLTLGVLGLLFGLLLSLASIAFHQKKSDRQEAILNLLPGSNCGGCGFAGCSGYAEALSINAASAGLCLPGGEKTISRIQSLLGLTGGKAAARKAYVFCYGSNESAKKECIYSGIPDCMAADLISGGEKSCQSGCLGYGNCAKVCRFSAITVSSEGLAEVNPEKCTGCGKCLPVCPRQLIKMVPAGKKVFVGCNSHEKGAQVKKVCDIGCIGCKVCEKVCKVQAIKVFDNLAVIDYEKCTECMLCCEKCPVGMIKGIPKVRSQAIIGNDCVGCGLCIVECPVKALSGEKKRKPAVDPTLCTGCGICVVKCPKQAISLKRQDA
ncbi:MAG: RnfABCDGE type electron transport complex subunit B [Candidatus Wallbacteria bacterium]|nr:RnfABCDGE type electron transport complex subunit B [Candidatus Wallbacteria bacterium]